MNRPSQGSARISPEGDPGAAGGGLTRGKPAKKTRRVSKNEVTRRAADRQVADHRVARDEKVMRKRTRGQSRAPRAGRGGFYIFMAALLSVGMCVFALTMFFDLRKIECVGTTRYTDSKIISLSGFEWGEDLLFVDRKRAEEAIVSELSWIKDAKIEIKLPDRAVIQLTERAPYGALQLGTSYFVFDEEGCVFDRVEYEPPVGAIVIKGAGISAPGIGLNVFSEDSEHMRPASQLLAEIHEAGLGESVRMVDVSESFNMRFSYMGRFTVELGINENIPGKLRMLDEVVSQLEPHQNGVIDLGAKRARYADDTLGGKL